MPVEPPAHFTADNEPYLERNSLYVLDVLISSVLDLSGRIADEIQKAHSTPLQNAAAHICSQGINLSLAIRELVRQGHLFSSAVLLRSLVERAAIISYLYRKPDALPVWENGWKHGERPSLVKMLAEAHPTTDSDGARRICETLNHLVHGDPYSAEFNLVALEEDAWGYAVGRVLKDNRLCDFVCDQTVSWLTVLAGIAGGCFPQAAFLREFNKSQ